MTPRYAKTQQCCPCIGKPPLSATCSISCKRVSSFNRHDCSSISFHMLWIFSLFAFAFSLFFAVRSNRSARRHLLTSVLALLHPPSALCRKPWAWHSSSAAMTSSQPVARIRTGNLKASGRGARAAGENKGLNLRGSERSTYLCCLWYGDEDASLC